MNSFYLTYNFVVRCVQRKNEKCLINNHVMSEGTVLSALNLGTTYETGDSDSIPNRERYN